ncbi:MAG: hypothetical protein CSA70_08310 [Rhodobacterales bacterium]|nr:MAG: hypothetical protein CSA70_08310 [Rhodobacterales bacterium]
MRGLGAALTVFVLSASSGLAQLQQAQPALPAQPVQSTQSTQQAPAHPPAQPAEHTARAQLYDALGLPAIIEVMHQEGAQFGADLGQDFLGHDPAKGHPVWAARVARIYDRDAMLASVRAALDKELPEAAIAPLLAFFTDEVGARIIEHELLARRAFLDQGTEDTARAGFRAARDRGERTERIALIRAYVAANDLVGYNVAGALNSNLRFYQGLVEGGAFEMSEEDMLRDVWEQEEETRTDTDEWLMAYLLTAYDPLADSDLDAYVTLSRSAEGKALNRALFAGFDAMYGDISYALGLAIAVEMRGQDL